MIIICFCEIGNDTCVLNCQRIRGVTRMRTKHDSDTRKRRRREAVFTRVNNIFYQLILTEERCGSWWNFFFLLLFFLGDIRQTRRNVTAARKANLYMNCLCGWMTFMMTFIFFVNITCSASEFGEMVSTFVKSTIKSINFFFNLPRDNTDVAYFKTTNVPQCFSFADHFFVFS